MNNALRNITLFLSCLISLPIIGQNTTYYYKLTKIIYHGEVKENTKGGQFITFTPSGCFDSDINGVNIGNGNLQYYKEYSSDAVRKYLGNSYFGNAVYKFSSNYNILNIEINKNYIYVYKRTSTPNGVRNSSLVKKNESHQGVAYPIWDQVLIMPPANNGIPLENQSTDYNERKRETLNRTYGENCKSCNGTGKCHACNGTKIASGLGNTYKCNICNENGDCPVCNGTGKTSWNR